MGVAHRLGLPGWARPRVAFLHGLALAYQVLAGGAAVREARLDIHDDAQVCSLGSGLAWPERPLSPLVLVSRVTGTLMSRGERVVGARSGATSPARSRSQLV